MKQLLSLALLAAEARAQAAPLCNVLDPVPYRDLEDLPPPSTVAQLVYAPSHHLLFVRSTTGVITVLDLQTSFTTAHTANGKFTDMALAPSGDYLFAADYPGKEGAFGEPGTGQHYGADKFALRPGRVRRYRRALRVRLRHRRQGAQRRERVQLRNQVEQAQPRRRACVHHHP